MLQRIFSFLRSFRLHLLAVTALVVFAFFQGCGVVGSSAKEKACTKDPKSQGCLQTKASASLDSHTKTDLDGDGRADLCARGANGLECWLSKGDGWEALPTLTVLSDAGGWNTPYGYESIQFADIDGDGHSDVCARGAAGLHCWILGTSGWTEWYGISALADAGGWYKAEYYQTMRFADINGDGRADMCIRGAGGLMCWTSSTTGWVQVPGIATLSDAGGWNNPVGYQSIQLADITGDGKADVCARGAAGLHCWIAGDGAWSEWPVLSVMSDANGWYLPQYYQTIQFADINGDGRADVCGRGGPGLECWTSGENGWVPYGGISVLSDAGGWNSKVAYESIQLADITGDGKADVCARGAAGLYCWISGNGEWTSWYGVNVMSDANGWYLPEYYQTIRFGDINGDGRADVCGRGGPGLECWVSTEKGWIPSSGLSAVSDGNGWNQKSYYQTFSLGPLARRNFETYATTTIAQWSLGSYYPATGMPISAIDFSGITHLIHCCAAFTADGGININVDWGNLEVDRANLIRLAHQNNVKVLLLLWVNDVAPLSGTSGANLIEAIRRDGAEGEAQRIVEALDRFGYDGLDLDWEWSKSVEDPATREAIISLLAGLRKRMPNKLITTDAFPSQAAQWTQAGAFKYVDRLNVMVYDMSFCCTNTWFNGAVSGEPSLESTWRAYQAAGAPLEKINLGIPFYGWQYWDGSTGPNQPRNMTADPNKRAQLSYASIAARFFQPPNVFNFDNVARVPWIQTTDGWITYDNEQSIAEKVRIIRENHIGGSSIWELSQDYFPTQTRKHPLLDAVKKSWPGINGAVVSP